MIKSMITRILMIQLLTLFFDVLGCATVSAIIYEFERQHQR